jgi:hypothetical protein
VSSRSKESIGSIMCAMKRNDGMGAIPLGSIREPMSRWGEAERDAPSL